MNAPQTLTELSLNDFLSSTFNVELLNKAPQNLPRRKYIRSILTPKLVKEMFNATDGSVNALYHRFLVPKGFERVSWGLIQDILCQAGITTKSLKQSANTQSVRQRFKNTCKQKWGTDNTLSKGTIGYDKKTATVKQKYGVDNIFAAQETVDKIRNTLLKRYGVTSAIHMPGRKDLLGRKSAIHKKIEEVLIKYGIAFISEHSLPSANFIYMGKKYTPRVDIFIESKNIVIEIFGNYWHANPLFYKSTDIIAKYAGPRTAEECWKFDTIRINAIKQAGLSVMVLWEYDIKNNFDQIDVLLRQNVV
jgi:G:T-mismatch repair DNA endonuclease (very short patch repair protein)